MFFNHKNNGRNGVLLKAQFVARMNDRVKFIKFKDTVRGGYDKLTAEALKAMKKVAAAEKLQGNLS